MWILSKENVAKLGKNHKNYCQKMGKEVKYTLYSEIEDNPDFEEIVEIINENMSKKLKKKWIELEKRES